MKSALGHGGGGGHGGGHGGGGHGGGHHGGGGHFGGRRGGWGGPGYWAGSPWIYDDYPAVIEVTGTCPPGFQQVDNLCFPVGARGAGLQGSPDGIGALSDSPALANVAYAAGAAGAVLGAYHGYKRNNSVGWAIGWFIFGGILPFLSIPLSLAEGFGKPKTK